MIYRKRLLTLLMLLPLLATAACASAPPADKTEGQTESPFIMEEGKKLRLNVYSMPQNDISLMGGIPFSPETADWTAFPKAEAVRIIGEVFAAHGFKSVPAQFKLGKIKCTLDGWHQPKLVGYLWLDNESLEKPRIAGLSGSLTG